ncbi:MAG: hypothetical protein AAFY19_04625 [Pseudomonadota bacterium]
MKTLLNASAFALLASLTLSPLAAQDQMPDRSAMAAEAEARMAEAKERLNLTEEQAAQVEVILQETNEKRSQAFQNANLQEGRNFRKMRQLRSDMKEVDKEATDRMAAVLDDEQMREYEAIKAEQRAEMKERMQNRQN